MVSVGFLDKSELLQMVQDQHLGRADESKQLWQLLTLEMWYREMRGLGVSGL
jgi:asparagine synthase (glutamine-hydrolysing)